MNELNDNEACNPGDVLAAISHLTEVLRSDTVILSTGHSMDIRQHLIFGLDEFSFMGTVKGTENHTYKTQTVQANPTPMAL